MPVVFVCVIVYAYGRRALILASVALTFTYYVSTNPVQSIEKTFQLTRADKDLLAKPEYDVQVCLILCAFGWKYWFAFDDLEMC